MSMTYNQRLLMEAAVKRVLSIAFNANTTVSGLKFNTDKEVDAQIEAVLSRLREEIEDVCETIATNKAEEKDDILLFIHRENHGSTFSERLSGYIAKFKTELEIVMGAALFLGMTRSEAAASIAQNFHNPYASSMMREAARRGYEFTAPSYGRGRTNSMFNAIARLCRHAIAEAYMRILWLRATGEGAVGFITFRNSSVPCDICDDYTTYTHPMTDPMPPLHLNCVCGVVFVFPGE